MNSHVFKWSSSKNKDYDLRSTRVTETIKGIKTVKFNAWEKIVMDLIARIRSIECVKMNKILKFTGWSDLGIELLPMNMAILIFGVYNGNFGVLSVS